VVAAVAIAGCPARVPQHLTVHGTVTSKGQPVRSGMLAFHGVDNDAYTTASIQADGTFIITGLLPGDFKVALMEAPRGSKSAAADPPVALDEKYYDKDSSGLRYSITPSTSTLAIELE
jgi:hypothetical protein